MQQTMIIMLCFLSEFKLRLASCFLHVFQNYTVWIY